MPLIALLLLFSFTSSSWGGTSNMEAARYYMGKRDYYAAINRLKAVVTQAPKSNDIEEALADLAEAFLAVGSLVQAGTAVAVLIRKYPNSQWTAKAYQALQSAGVEPIAVGTSWISRSFD
jgi:outer membrane protein assembly factor BamD